MDATLQALAEPTRRAILDLVRDRELAAGEVAQHFDVTRPAISQHLGVLRHAGLISERREGTRRLYRARPEGMAELREYLEGFWAVRLQQLKQAVEEAEQVRPGAGGGSNADE
jgi:DNA-binding transcriptional ArsR family regulator